MHTSPRRPFGLLRFEPLEPRETPAAVRVIDFTGGFTEAALPGGRPAGYADGDLLLTDGPYQATAAWTPDRVHVGSFHTSFVFRLAGEPGRLGDGFTFTLRGTHPSGPGASGGGLGYQGITDSVAVKFDLVDNAGEGSSSVGVFTGGADPTTPAASLDGSPIHLHAQTPIRADITYDGTTLTVTLTDTTAPDRSVTRSFAIDLPGALGGPTAFAGFTGGTGELFARQVIESWTFDEVVPDAPASQPPKITTPASRYQSGADLFILQVGAADDGGAEGLTYTWEVAAAPPGAAVQFTPQLFERSAAQAHVNAYGTYTFRVTVRDEEGQTATSEVTYNYEASVSRIEITPRQATVPAGGTFQFRAIGYDVFGKRLPEPVGAFWGVWKGPGTIDSNGLYTAPPDAAGFVTIHAERGRTDRRPPFTVDEVVIQVMPAAPANRPPQIEPISIAWFSPSYISLRATATDDGGAAGLTYAWEVVTAPEGVDRQLGSWSPTVAIARADRYGHYVFRVTVTDAQGLAATRTVSYDPAVTIFESHSAPTSLPVVRTAVVPQEATVAPGRTVQLAIDVRDSAGNRVPDPTATWRVAWGPGTIDANGLYTAPAGASGEVGIEARAPVFHPTSPPGEWATYYARVFILPDRPPGAGVDLGGGFAGAELSQNGSAGVTGDRLRLAVGPHQAGSAFAPGPVHVRGFATSFRFQVGDRPDPRYGDGLAFVLQNAGPAAVGKSGAGLGYEGIPNSVAVKVDLVGNAGEGAQSVGVFTGGAEPTVPAAVLDGTPLHLHSGHVFRADLSYSGGTLVVDLRDTVTGQRLVRTFQVDIPAAVGGPTAIVGFTGGTGELYAPIDVLDWTYTPTTDATGNAAPVIVRGQVPDTFHVRDRYVVFSALGADDGQIGDIWHTWEVVSAPAGAGPVRLETSSFHTGHAPVDSPWLTLATFDRAGEYTFRLTTHDRQGNATRSDPVRVVVEQVPWDLVVTPAAPTVPAGGTVGIAVEVLDQFGDPLAGPAGDWRFVLEGPGFIDEDNAYHAPADWTGVVTIRATTGTTTGVTVVNVVRP